MKQLITFLVFSSQNPKRISLSIKAGSVFIASLLVFLNINLDITPLVDQFIELVNALLVVVSAGYTMYGLIRKALVGLGIW